jgi:hypothetical protein
MSYNSSGGVTPDQVGAPAPKHQGPVEKGLTFRDAENVLFRGEDGIYFEDMVLTWRGPWTREGL